VLGTGRVLLGVQSPAWETMLAALKPVA
jgi:hypothetical protein